MSGKLLERKPDFTDAEQEAAFAATGAPLPVVFVAAVEIGGTSTSNGAALTAEHYAEATKLEVAL